MCHLVYHDVRVHDLRGLSHDVMVHGCLKLIKNK